MAEQFNVIQEDDVPMATFDFSRVGHHTNFMLDVPQLEDIDIMDQEILKAMKTEEQREDRGQAAAHKEALKKKLMKADKKVTINSKKVREEKKVEQ